MQLSDFELATVLAMPGPERYEYFVKQVAGGGKVWGLYRDGWALAGAGQQQVLPLWPNEQFAEMCAAGPWEGHLPASFSVQELLDVVLPKLAESALVPGIFYTPTDQGVIAAPADLAAAVKAAAA